MQKKNGTWIFNLIKILCPMLVILSAICIAWGVQYNQVTDNTSDISINTTNIGIIKADITANRECIIRIETKLEVIEKRLIEQTTAMETGFSEIKVLLWSKE